MIVTRKSKLRALLIAYNNELQVSMKMDSLFPAFEKTKK